MKAILRQILPLVQWKSLPIQVVRGFSLVITTPGSLKRPHYMRKRSRVESQESKSGHPWAGDSHGLNDGEPVGIDLQVCPLSDRSLDLSTFNRLK